MGSSMFWGILLIVIGLSLVIKIVFNVEFPIFKILIAFVFLYIGLRILLGHSVRPFNEHRTETDVVFGESNFSKIDNDKEYNVVFSKGTFDLRNVELNAEGSTRVKINTVFGGSKVILNSAIPTRIKVDAVFAGANMPNGNSAAFGSTIYMSDSLDMTKPFLDIKADVVFGGLQVVNN